MKLLKLTLVAALGAGMLAANTVWADTFSFLPTNPNANNQVVTVGNLFQLEVLDAGSNQVTFNFTNQNTTNSAIIAVYIGGPNVFSANSFVQSAGVSFSSTNQQQPQTGFAIEAAAKSNNQGGGNFVNGIDEGGIESLTYTLTLATGYSFSQVIDFINTSDLQVGVTGQTNNQGNDQYIIAPNPPSAVPVPAAAWLFATGLGMFGIGRKRLS